MFVRRRIILALSDNGDSRLFLEQTHQGFTEETILHSQVNAYRKLQRLVNVPLLQQRNSK